MTTEERIKDRKIGILGMARSGLAAAKLALEKQGRPFVSDAADASALQDECARLDSLQVPYEIGGHTERLLTCDYLVLSPGVPLGLEILEQARRQGLPLFSELEFASWVCPGRLIAITGSNGKTTTTTLVGEMLIAAGIDAHVCGNVGRPLAEVVSRMTAASVAVVEVSSFQLETISEFKPEVATILNLTPDHLDRHGSFETYKRAKYRLTENQTAQDYLVLNHDDQELTADNPSSGAQTLRFTATTDDSCAVFVRAGQLCLRQGEAVVPIISCDEIAIKGPHNLQNAAAAVAMVHLLDVKPTAMARVLASFPGVEHRLEPVGTVAGVSFINDSKATNVDSVWYALKSMTTPVYLILGGRDKGGDFKRLVEVGKSRVRGVIVMGEAREKIFEAIGRSFNTQFADSLQEAVELGFNDAHPGETVLLSPGCASFDMFDNYEHRGREFKNIIAGLKEATNSGKQISS